MALTKDELKATIKGVLLAAGTWMLIFPIKDAIVEYTPLKSTFAIGIALIVFVLFWD